MNNEEATSASCIVRTQENVQVGDIRRYRDDDEKVLYIAEEECNFPVFVQLQVNGYRNTGKRRIEDMQRAPLRNPTPTTEPEHAFPEDDDDLVGEMFEDRLGDTWTVLDYPQLPTQEGVRSCACRCEDGRLREMWEPDTIRDRTPLGPSPAKIKLQTLKYVAETAKAIDSDTSTRTVSVPLAQMMDKLSTAIHALNELKELATSGDPLCTLADAPYVLKG